MQSRKKYIGAILALGVVFGSMSEGMTEPSDWLRRREVAYKAWQKTNIVTDAKIADLKTKTANLVQQREAAMKTVSARLTDPPVIFRASNGPISIWDAPFAPPMVVVPAGEYTMGSPISGQDSRVSSTSPAHRVTIAAAFAVSKYNVTRDEFSTFVAMTNRQMKVSDSSFLIGCKPPVPSDTTQSAVWFVPEFAQSGDDPAVCVSWDDAQAYASWLSMETGKQYRLLSDAEWEYAARAGTTTAYYWGGRLSRQQANYGMEKCCAGFSEGKDRWVYTSPSGSFPPNPFGLYDMLGNVLQWTADYYNFDCDGVPINPAVPRSGVCSNRRIVRGGSWYETGLSVVLRNRAGIGIYNNTIGFRVAREL